MLVSVLRSNLRALLCNRSHLSLIRVTLEAHYLSLMKRSSTARNLREAARVEAFSDGVFAIAITLLVLELIQTMHPKPGEKLLEVCLNHWQSFFAFTVGFVTILVCWINHHIAMESIKKIDTPFLWINGFLLFIVTLAPLPTAMLAEYIDKDSNSALAMFSFTYILISVAADAICTYAYSHHLVEEERRPEFAVYKRIYRYAIFYNMVAFALCFVSIIIPIAMDILMFAAFAAPEAVAKRLVSRRHRIIKK
jgi:uncharacterized membrane protein